MFGFEIIVEKGLRKILGGSIVGDMWNSLGYTLSKGKLKFETSIYTDGVRKG